MSITITKEQLIAFCPASVPFLDGLQQCADRYSINSAFRVQHFMAQCAHESGGFLSFREGMSYSPQGLMDTFPRYFKDQHTAEAYARQPEKTGNYVYANRNGNGNALSGDGYNFRGRGPLQVTGRLNYASRSRNIFKDDRLVNEPSLVERPTIGILCAGDWWQENGVNLYADVDDLAAVSGVVNTGSPSGKAHGLDSRKQWLTRSKAVW